MLCVFVAQEGFVGGYLPVDAKAAVQNADAAICLGCVEVVALVLEDCGFAEDGKAVGEAFGHEELTVVILCQLDCNVLSVCGRTFADIDCHIKHLAFDGTDEFALGERWTLEMKPTHHSVGGH